MDTTQSPSFDSSGAEGSVHADAGSTDPDDVDGSLERLAAADPADAPELAETLAAELASELEATGVGPRQLRARFDAGRDDS